MLLFRKSDFLIFKVSNSNMPQFFLGTKLFCLLSEWAEKKGMTCLSIFFSAHSANFYFLTPQLVTWGVKNSTLSDLLDIQATWQTHHVFVKYRFFQLIWTTNKQKKFLEKNRRVSIWDCKKSDFLNSNMP